MFSKFLARARKLFKPVAVSSEPTVPCLAEPVPCVEEPVPCVEEPVACIAEPVPCVAEPVRNDSPVTPVIEPYNELIEHIKKLDSEEQGTISAPIVPNNESSSVEFICNDATCGFGALPKCSDTVVCECTTNPIIVLPKCTDSVCECSENQSGNCECSETKTGNSDCSENQMNNCECSESQVENCDLSGNRVKIV